MHLIDTHCHLDVPEFDPDREQVLARARAAGVRDIVVPGIYAAAFQRLADLCRPDPGLHPAFGLHPVYLEQHRPGDLDILKEWIRRERPVAIGEVGLDYFVRHLDRARQRDLFEAQVRIARDAGLPLLLHLRKSHDDAWSILRRLKFPHGGIAHAFNGSEQQAWRFIDMGFKLGFGGVVTFERSRKIRRLAAELPLECIVLETDAPDLTPAWRYGERNSPEYLPGILEVVAGLRGEGEVVVSEASTCNAGRRLRLG